MDIKVVFMVIFVILLICSVIHLITHLCYLKNTSVNKKSMMKKGNSSLEKFATNPPSKNILIINEVNFHHEILESLFTIFLKKIYDTDFYSFNVFKIFMLTYPNEEYEKYITSKYKNVKFVRNKPLDVEFDTEIWATIYPCDIEKIVNENSKKSRVKKYYISHRVDSEMLKIKNIYFLTPLCGDNNYIIPSTLPVVSKVKTDIPILCIQGNLDEKRRNYKSMECIFESFKKYDFKVKIIGKGSLPKYLEKYKDKIIFEPNLGFSKYHEEFKDVYVILALIDETFEHNYFNTQLTSSISYSIEYDIPILYYTKLHDIYKLKNSVVYSSDKEFRNKFKGLIESFKNK